MSTEENKKRVINELIDQYEQLNDYLKDHYGITPNAFKRFLEAVKMMPVELFGALPTVLLKQRGFTWSTIQKRSLLTRDIIPTPGYPSVLIPIMNRRGMGTTYDVEVLGHFPRRAWGENGTHVIYKDDSSFYSPTTEGGWKHGAKGISSAMLELL